MAMLNLSIQDKEGWSLILCKSPLSGMNVILLTFNERFFRLTLIGRFRLMECRMERKRKKERKRENERKRRCKENY